MSTIHIAGSTIVEEIDGEQSVRHYSPSIQEQTQETPEQVDSSPITEAERDALDKASADTFQPVFADQPHDRAANFEVPGTFVHPTVIHRRRAAMTLPSFGQVTDLEQRIGAVMRFDGAPKQVATLAQKARDAVSAARDAHHAGRNAENPRYAVSQTAKDAAIQEIAKATTAVAALEAATREESVREAWFESLVGNLDKQRAEALKTLRAAEKTYSALRGSIGAANALAIEQGRWDKSWHSSTVREAELNAPIASMRDAIGFLDGEGATDYTTGAFLVADYGDSIPPHSLSRLKRAAEVAGGGSFAEQVYARAVSPMANDRDTQDAISQKRLVLLLNSNPSTADLRGKRDQD